VLQEKHKKRKKRRNVRGGEKFFDFRIWRKEGKIGRRVEENNKTFEKVHVLGGACGASLNSPEAGGTLLGQSKMYE
jgi:hypothetical protein